MKKIGLALGGGAARGLAHIGVLKGFMKYEIPISYIAGTSAGAIVGGLFSVGLSLDKMEDLAYSLSWRDFARFAFSRKALVTSDPMSKLLKGLVGHPVIGDCQIPFAALSTDLLTGEGVVLKDSDLDLATVLRASSSFPGIYKPIKLKDRYLVDGGASHNIPTQVVRDMGADIVVAVDVIPYAPLSHVPRHMAALLDRGLDLLLRAVTQKMTNDADFVLQPVSVQVTSFQVKKAKLLIELGEKAVDDHIEAIRRCL